MAKWGIDRWVAHAKEDGSWARDLGDSGIFIVERKVLTLFLPVQGKLYVRGDSKVFRFQNGKSESLFLQRKNPRLIAWTTLYRRQHRKGISEVRSTPPRTPRADDPLSPRTEGPARKEGKTEKTDPLCRKSPRRGPAAPSSPSAPSLVLRSM